MASKTKLANLGLIAAWRLTPDEPPDKLDEPAMLGALAAGESGLWLHVDMTDPRARDLFVRLPIPALARRALLDPDDSPHLEAADGAVFGGIADFKQAAGGSIPETGLLHVALTAEMLVTGQFAPLRTTQIVSRDPECGSPAEVLARLMHGIADGMAQAAQYLSTQLTGIEDGLLTNQSGGADRQTLSAVRRAALRLERAFAPTAETLSHWAEEPTGTVAEPFCVPILREARWENTVERVLLAVQERARITQDELAVITTEETNRRLFVLSVLSAAILPATLITGIFGMNVGAVPGVDREWGFMMAMGLVVGSILFVLAALRLTKLL